MISTGLLPQSATITRPTDSIRSTGAVTHSFAAVASGVACSLQPANDRLAQRYVGEIPTGVWRLFVAASTDLQKGDRVAIGSSSYEALEVNDAAGRSHHLEAVLGLDRREI